MGIWSLEHLVGGLSGGFVSTLVVHPLDFLKVRFAANEGAAGRPQYGGYVAAARAVIRDGGARSLYQGLTPNLIGNTLAWGLYFHLFNTMKSWLRESESHLLDAHVNLAVGFASGMGTLAVTNPIWVAKTRLCLQYEGQGRTYRGLVHVLTSILRTEGIRGWYKGFLPGIVGTSHGAVQFMTYEELRRLHSQFTGTNVAAKLGPLEYVMMATVSKLVAVTSTYPYQVVRTRLQDQHASYSGVRDVIRRTWKGEGARGFYKGLLPSMVRQLPATGLTFLVYENVTHELRMLRQAS